MSRQIADEELAAMRTHAAALEQRLVERNEEVAALREALHLIASNALVDQDDSVWVARDALKDYVFVDLPSAPQWFKDAAQKYEAMMSKRNKRRQEIIDYGSPAIRQMPTAQPVAPEGRWHLYDDEQTLEAFSGWMLVAERRDQPDRGWFFKYGTDAMRLTDRLNALEAEVAALRYQNSLLNAALEREIAKVAALRKQLQEFHGWDSDTWRELADRAKPSMAFIFGNAKWAENQAVVREWLADYDAAQKAHD